MSNLKQVRLKIELNKAGFLEAFAETPAGEIKIGSVNFAVRHYIQGTFELFESMVNHVGKKLAKDLGAQLIRIDPARGSD